MLELRTFRIDQRGENKKTRKACQEKDLISRDFDNWVLGHI